MSKKVLAVDDDPIIRSMVKEMLLAEGFEVILAENGLLGLETLTQPDFTKDLTLIILDVMMPGMTGIELLTKVKQDELAPSIPVVMLTAEATSNDVLKGYNSGADYYITKPFTRQQLVHGLSIVLS
jgi:DNA-binding response OmpR family regulator